LLLCGETRCHNGSVRGTPITDVQDHSAIVQSSSSSVRSRLRNTMPMTNPTKTTTNSTVRVILCAVLILVVLRRRSMRAVDVEIDTVAPIENTAMNTWLSALL